MPKDTRTYITLHDGVVDNRKIKPRSDKAFRTWIELLSWCSRELSDGLIPADIFRLFGTAKARNELITAGLVEPHGSDFFLHDYLEHQRSKEQVLALRKSRSEAGSRGGKAKAEASKTLANAKQNGSKTVAVSVSETDTSPIGEVGVVPRAAPATRGTRLTEEFTVTPEMVAWANERVPGLDGKRSTETFMNYWIGKSGSGATKVDWVRTWQNWLIKDFDEGRHMRPSSTAGTPRPGPRNGPLTAAERGRRADEDALRWMGFDPNSAPSTQEIER